MFLIDFLEKINSLEFFIWLKLLTLTVGYSLFIRDNVSISPTPVGESRLIHSVHWPTIWFLTPSFPIFDYDSVPMLPNHVPGNLSLKVVNGQILQQGTDGLSFLIPSHWAVVWGQQNLTSKSSHSFFGWNLFQHWRPNIVEIFNRVQNFRNFHFLIRFDRQSDRIR